MKKLLLVALTLWFAEPTYAQTSPARVAIAIHGGAGTILRENMTPEREAEYRATLNQALIS